MQKDAFKIVSCLKDRFFESQRKKFSLKKRTRSYRLLEVICVKCIVGCLESDLGSELCIYIYIYIDIFF